jgi:hypothetical protein
MSQPIEDPAGALLRLTNGYQVSQAIHVAATLKLADFIGDEPRHAGELAGALAVHENALYRLLRALATVGIFRETEDRAFVSTPISELLRSDHPRGMQGWPVFIGGAQHRAVWGDLLYSIQTGEDASRHIYGMSIWDWRAQQPGEATIFNNAMAALSNSVAEAVAAAYDFDRFERIVDIGGADGTLLTAILAAHPRPHGVVFDLPKSVAEATPVIAAAGLSERCEAVAGSYFDVIPPGAGAYLLKSVLHDCSDEDSRRILENIRKAMPADGAVLIVEALMQPAASTPRDAFSDLNMLVSNGGREREPGEWKTLLADAGFELTGITPTTTRFHVIEGRAAPG